MNAGSDSLGMLRTTGGTTDDIRERNLAGVLAHLHHDGSLSRAELTRRMGLNRSTMGVLVADLVRLGLVVESDSVPGGAGRPSRMVSIADDLIAFSVNPEVGLLRVAAVGPGGRIVTRASVPLPSAPSVADVVGLASALVAGMRAGHPEWRVIGAGAAVPGQVRVTDGVVAEATHFGWTGEPLAEPLARTLGMPVWAANAAILALRAERAFGVARDLDDLFYIIGGASGIGGGAVSGGRMLLGSSGFAGEVGHVLAVPGGAACPCGSSGCFEAEVTEAAMLAAVGLDAAGREQLSDRWRDRGDDPEVRAVGEAHREVLGRVLRDVVNLFNPGTVVVAGFLEPLVAGRGGDALAAEAIRSSRAGLRIVAAEVPDAVLLGAAELVFSALIENPSAFAAV